MILPQIAENVGSFPELMGKRKIDESTLRIYAIKMWGQRCREYRSLQRLLAGDTGLALR